MWNSARKLRLNHTNSSMNRRRSRGIPLKSANTDDIPLQHIQSCNPSRQIQRITSRKLPTESYEEQVENYVNHNNYEYRRLQTTTNKCRKSCDKCSDVHVTDYDEQAILLPTISQDKTNGYDKLIIQHDRCNNGCLHYKMQLRQPAPSIVRSQGRSPGLQPFYFLSHDSPHMIIPWYSCRPSIQSTKFRQNFSNSQQISLIGQSPHHRTTSGNGTLLTSRTPQ